MHYNSLEVRFANDVRLKVFTVYKKDTAKDCSLIINPELEILYSKEDLPDGKIIFNEEAAKDGLLPLQFLENVNYIWILENGENVELKSGLTEKGFLSEIERGRSWTFKVTNYLGTGCFEINEEKFEFDVIPEKFNSQEYSEITGDIAEFCRQLLLEWSAPTALNFISDPEEEKKIILEQFLFLREFFKQDKFDYYMEMISNNPHRKLEIELEKRDISYGAGRDFLENPMRYGWNWQPTVAPVNIRGYLPDETVHSRKYDSFDTPPNRLLKYAMEYFSEICSEVIAKNPSDMATLEAKEITYKIQRFLNSHIMEGVKKLTDLPLNNPTLQRREGYRQLLETFLQIENASKLNWQGKQDVFKGKHKSVDVLYEYWLYIRLYNILKDELNLTYVKTKEDNSFWKYSDDELIIHLKQGQESISVFIHEKLNLQIHLYFNKVFSNSNAKELKDSYTKIFRPDISLVILPLKKESEKSIVQLEENALREGSISYLHFDAKYRIDKMYIFPTSESEDEEKLKKEEKSTNVYKNGDLYKMHTYNEAIRKTVGSYILYPGEKNQYFGKYHEILPGVGAFAMKPGIENDEVIKFISEILQFQSSRYTQNYRINYHIHQTTTHENKELDVLHHRFTYPEKEVKPAADIPVMVGFIRPQDLDIIVKNKLFYFHAIENGRIVKLDKQIFSADYLIPGVGDGRSLDWYGKVGKIKLVSKKLINRIKKRDDENSVSHYYLVSLSETFPIEPIISDKFKASRPKIYSWKEIFTGHPVT